MRLQGLVLAFFLGLIVVVTIATDAVAAVRLPYVLDCVGGAHHVLLQDRLFDCRVLLHCDELDGDEIYQEPLLGLLGLLVESRQQREGQLSSNDDDEEEEEENLEWIPDDALDRCDLECGCLREDAKLLYERLDEQRQEQRRLVHGIQMMAYLPLEEVERELEEGGGRGRGRGLSRHPSILGLSDTRAYGRRVVDRGREAAIRRGAFPGVKKGRRKEGLLGFSGSLSGVGQGWGGGQVGGFGG